QRWMLTADVTRLTQKWLIELDLQWTVGAKVLKITQHAPKLPDGPAPPLYDHSAEFPSDTFTFFKEPRPLGDNPYSLDSSRWHDFEEATYNAKKELDSLWLEYLQSYGPAATHADIFALILQGRLKRLDIIAEEMLGVHVIDESTAGQYEDWLVNLMRH